MTINMLRGRQVVASLTNQSGGAVIAGDVVIVSAANDESFTTTTSASYNTTRVGVALDSIAAAASGRILLEGYAPLVNVSASATRGHYLLTHTVAKQATSQAGYAAGAFGQILKAGTSPSAMIFPVAQVGSAGITRSGATTDNHLAAWDGSNADSIKDGGVATPSDATYITTAVNASLSAEVAIPGLAGSPDIAGAAGAGTSEEYDTNTTGLTWNNTPTTVDSNTTILSHLYIVCQADTTERIGTKAWSPAGAFDARCKVMGAWNASGTIAIIGLHIGNSDNSLRAMVQFTSGLAGCAVQAYTYASSTFTQRGSAWVIATNQVYFRITRDGSNNVSFYWSSNGLMWQFIATQSLAITVANIGFRLQSSASGTVVAAVDWLRTSV